MRQRAGGTLGRRARPRGHAIAARPCGPAVPWTRRDIGGAVGPHEGSIGGGACGSRAEHRPPGGEEAHAAPGPDGRLREAAVADSEGHRGSAALLETSPSAALAALRAADEGLGLIVGDPHGDPASAGGRRGLDAGPPQGGKASGLRGPAVVAVRGKAGFACAASGLGAPGATVGVLALPRVALHAGPAGCVIASAVGALPARRAWAAQPTTSWRAADPRSRWPATSRPPSAPPRRRWSSWVSGVRPPWATRRLGRGPTGTATRVHPGGETGRRERHAPPRRARGVRVRRGSPAPPVPLALRAPVRGRVPARGRSRRPGASRAAHHGGVPARPGAVRVAPARADRVHGGDARSRVYREPAPSRWASCRPRVS